jgi:hypothetical protein
MRYFWSILLVMGLFLIGLTVFAGRQVSAEKQTTPMFVSEDGTPMPYPYPTPTPRPKTT